MVKETAPVTEPSLKVFEVLALPVIVAEGAKIAQTDEV